MAEIFACRVSEEEEALLMAIKGHLSKSEFLREVIRTSPLVQNHAQRLGKDVDLIFQEKKRGGKRPGAGNPNWKKKPPSM